MKRWTALLLALMLCLSLFPIGASAAEFGNLEYEISDGEVAITSIPVDAKIPKDYYNTAVEIPSEIEGCPVTSIKHGVASGRLELVKIPASVKVIEERAFDFDNLKAVYYAGTEEEWNQITIGKYNEGLDSAKIHYSWTSPLPSLYSFSIGDTQLVSAGDLVGELPQGVSYDAENSVITLENFQAPDSSLRLECLPAPVTLKLIGENTISYLDANTNPVSWLQVTGDGILNLQELAAKHFVMDSGTINLKCISPSNLKYGFYNMNYGNKEAENLNYFRFLGGTVNVDMTATPEDPSEDAHFVGMDVQSGNMEIRNAEVHINLGDNPWLGLGVGWMAWDSYDPNGGTLTMENGTLEITSVEYQAYLYELKNEGNPLHCYVGTDGPEKEVNFEEAFPKDWIGRHNVTSDGKGYLLITDKTVELQPPKVTPTPTPAPTAKPDAENPFKDVSKDQYYYEPVLWAVKNGITQGTSATTFSPAATCTRGQVVTFLWRAAGEPKPTVTKNPYTDVKSTDYFYNAVLWAAEHEITRGTSATTFSPNDPCTRAHVVTFLWRSEGLHAADRESPFTDIDHFDYFYDAVIWAVKQGITQGTSATTFSPNAPCTRGQIVTFLYRDKK